MIHRDIKPENVLLHDGRAMVMDFGIALAVSAAAGGRMTETGLSLGTPHDMSPEQATADREITGRSDVYSLASVLYEMLTRDPPHTGATVQQIIMKIVTEEAQPVNLLRRNVPPNVAAAVAKALEKVVADRFATAAEFGAALTNAAFRTAQIDAPSGSRPLRRLVNLQSSQGADLAISEDGNRFAYLGTAGSRAKILMREGDQLDPEPIRGADDVRGCLAFSPDGQSLAYITLTALLKVVFLQGAISRTVAGSGLQDFAPTAAASAGDRTAISMPPWSMASGVSHRTGDRGSV